MDPLKPSETPETPETPPAETPEGQTPETPETPAAAQPASAEQVQQALKALADIRDQWKNRPTPEAQDTAEKIREQIKEQTGWTDAQLDWHQNSVVNAVAPVQEELHWLRLEKAHPDISKFKDAMLKELSEGYTPAQRANPVVLEKVYYLAKGRAMEQTPPSSRPAGQEQPPKPKIAPGYGGMGSGTDQGSRAPGTTLTDEQREYSRRLGVPEESYKRAMATKNVRELKTA